MKRDINARISCLSLPLPSTSQQSEEGYASPSSDNWTEVTPQRRTPDASNSQVGRAPNQGGFGACGSR